MFHPEIQAFQDNLQRYNQVYVMPPNKILIQFLEILHIWYPFLKKNKFQILKNCNQIDFFD